MAAHQISTVTGIIVFAIVIYFIFKRWKFESLKHAVLVGIVWPVLNILLEFGFRHYIMGNPWEKLLHDYNLAQGRVWSLFLVWVAIAPYVFYKITNNLKS